MKERELLEIVPASAPAEKIERQRALVTKVMDSLVGASFDDMMAVGLSVLGTVMGRLPAVARPDLVLIVTKKMGEALLMHQMADQNDKAGGRAP